MVSKGTRDAEVPWDIFFEGDRKAIDAWRKSTWKNIRRELRVDFGFEVPDGLEPHWTSPGTAVFYTKDTTVKFESKVDESRHNLQGFVEEDDGHWTVTSPMPVGNAQQFSRYIERKGFRLRPPLNGVDGRLKEVVESAVSPEVPDPEYDYRCEVHNVEFLTWRGYRQHCRARREQADLSMMPEGTRMTVGQFDFYCAQHNFGTFSARAARDHRKVHLRIPSPGQHSTVEQMTVKRPAAAVATKEKEK